ncbi:MAG: hypothetical protein WD491_14825 [Balneolales bacterium]
MIAPDIAIDDEGIPHIVFLQKEMKTAGLETNAVYCATDSNMDGKF